MVGAQVFWIPENPSGEPQVGKLGQAQGLTGPECVHFLWGQEALRKIITTLAVKNEEIQSFIYSLKQMLLNMEVRAGGWEGGRGQLYGLAYCC